LRRKKQHEHTLDQTVAQIATLEQQIYSIEAANINRETLAAMEKAGQAMKQIHGKLNIDTVDETMYVDILHHQSEIRIQSLILCL
jgi:charged multivesicular body protein 4